MHRQLIINADDFGLTPGVTEGILYGAKAGCVSSTTVMVNQFMHLKLSFDPTTAKQLGMGVHLNLTSGKPILPAEDLSTLVVPEGNFRGKDFIYHHADVVNLVQVEKEWRAQVIGFLIKFGQPDHIDSHHHIHLLPQLFPIFLQIAGEMRIPIRFPILMDGLDGFPYQPNYSGMPEEISQEVINEDLKILEQSGVRFPDYFIDDFITPNIDQPDVLMEFFHHLPEGVTEMMCHPGYLDDLLYQMSTFTQIRVDQLKALTAPQLRGILEHEQIDLIGFHQI
jgi:chitin disaccharide deacetylase